jgi:hypothetical protein
MSIIERLKAAWLAFRDPDLYWEGVSIRKTAREISDRDRMAILRRDPECEYVIEMMPYEDQRAILNYLGR